ncbi:recombinase RecT [bacterium]|nr:recombinase RecT [bacterium]
MNLYTPSSHDELISTANLLTNNNAKEAFELILQHAQFGHHFGGHMGLTQVNCVTIKGKPTMRADALAGICRNSGLVRRLQVTVLNDEVCTIEAERSDEAPGIIHTHSFSYQMAEQMGLTRNSNWQRMRKQMLRARGVAAICRAVYPDAVSGIYTADEMADSMDGISDKERFELSAASVGEDDLRYAPSNAPQQRPAPQPSRKPQPQPQPKPQPKPQRSQRSLYEFTDEQSFWRIIDEHNISADEVRGAIHRMSEDVSIMSPAELSDFFYTVCLHSVTRRTDVAGGAWWDNSDDKVAAVHGAFKTEYPALSLVKPSFYGPRLAVPAWVETMRHVCSITDDEKRSEGLNVIKQMQPDDWSAYDYILSL